MDLLASSAMTAFWFISAPLPGHLDWGGYLRTARVLSSRGHDVLWISQSGIQRMVETAAIPFAAIPETGWLWPPPPPPDTRDLDPAVAAKMRYARALDTWLSEELIPPAVEALIALAHERGKPDVIVTDPFLSAAALAAEALDVPLAVAGWPAGSPPDENRLLDVQVELGRTSQERIERLSQRFGLQGINFSKGATPSIQSPHLHISYFSRSWHQAEPDFLPQTHFVGGKAVPPVGDPPEWLRAIPPEKPMALITLGTTFIDDLSFFTMAAVAAARLGFIPLVVIGGTPLPPDKKAAFKATLPPGTYLLPWVDFDHVLPRLAVIVHHGGMGTTHHAILHGLPQVVVPHAADQRGQARRVAQAKIGLNLGVHDVRSGQLLPAIRAVTADDKVREAARNLAQEFATLGGVEWAADLLLDCNKRE